MIPDYAIGSFDIFDTILTRYVARPKDIFLLMQNQLLEGYVDLPLELSRNFYAIRPKAEIKARLKKYFFEKREVSLYDIYAQIAEEFKLDKTHIQKLMDLECKIEYQSVCPIQWTLSRVNSFRRTNKRIIFVSDMYLPIGLIKDMLIKVGAYQGSDGIYLSSDIGFKKFNGGLFRYILKREKCRPHEICHFGDNHYSDVFIPFLLGISIDPCRKHTTSI